MYNQNRPLVNQKRSICFKGAGINHKKDLVSMESMDCHRFCTCCQVHNFMPEVTSYMFVYTYRSLGFMSGFMNVVVTVHFRYTHRKLCVVVNPVSLFSLMPPLPWCQDLCSVVIFLLWLRLRELISVAFHTCLWIEIGIILGCFFCY